MGVAVGVAGTEIRRVTRQSSPAPRTTVTGLVGGRGCSGLGGVALCDDAVRARACARARIDAKCVAIVMIFYCCFKVGFGLS